MTIIFISFYKLNIIFLVLLSVTTQPSSSEDTTETCDRDVCAPNVKKCTVFDPNNFGPENKTIIYGEARGRIGNQLLGYALMLQLRRQLDVDSYIDTNCKDLVGKTFTPENVEVPVLSETFCNPKDLKFEAFHGRFADLLTDPSFRRGRIINFYPADDVDFLKGGYKPEDHIGPEQEAFQIAYVNYLKKNLKFKPSIQTRVKKILKKMAKKLGVKSKEVTFVGIHNRRTDHFELVKKISGQEPLEKSYFYDAMEYFREEYENVAFAYVSDDMAWGKKNIKNKHGDLFFVGAGENLDENGKEIVDPDAAPFDLALLVNCNHTIISRGTFSMWAAMLAGGEYYTEYGAIVPTYLQG